MWYMWRHTMNNVNKLGYERDRDIQDCDSMVCRRRQYGLIINTTRVEVSGMESYEVQFDGDVESGYLTIECTDICVDNTDDCVIHADGINIILDSQIITIKNAETNRLVYNSADAVEIDGLWGEREEL